MNCPYCGAPIIGNAKFCMNCGAAVPYSDESPLSYAEASAPVSQAYRPEITSVQDLPPQFRPMSPWADLGCSLLFRPQELCPFLLVRDSCRFDSLRGSGRDGRALRPGRHCGGNRNGNHVQP